MMTHRLGKHPLLIPGEQVIASDTADEALTRWQYLVRLVLVVVSTASAETFADAFERVSWC